jgi:hypothetical protein
MRLSSAVHPRSIQEDTCDALSRGGSGAGASLRSREGGRVQTDEYTFGRPKGTVEEEIAGVMMTLQHIGNMEKIDIQDATLAELERISTPEMRKKIYDKQSYKNIHGLVA